MSTNDADLRAWQQGQTGIPIVDAGMRHYAWLHAQPFADDCGVILVKNLGHHWVEGENGFAIAW